MAKRNYKLTEGEWIIMQALWELEPCAAPSVQEELLEQTAWTYSTVKTMMDRMVKKGLLKTEKIRNLILYRSAITLAQARKGEITDTIKRAFNGALTPMMQFLLDSHDFTTEQLGEMEAVIKGKRKLTGKGKKG